MLSQKKVVSVGKEMPTSHSIKEIQVTSAMAIAIALYSTPALEQDIVSCFLMAQ